MAYSSSRPAEFFPFFFTECKNPLSLCVPLLFFSRLFSSNGTRFQSVFRSGTGTTQHILWVHILLAENIPIVQKTYLPESKWPWQSEWVEREKGSGHRVASTVHLPDVCGAVQTPVLLSGGLLLPIHTKKNPSDIFATKRICLHDIATTTACTSGGIFRCVNAHISNTLPKG